MLNRAKEIFFITGGLLALTWLMRLADVDLWLSGRVFFPEGVWPGVVSSFWQAVYVWAPLPGLLVGVTAVLVLVAGVWSLRLRTHRKEALFLVALLLIGPWFLVNHVLKDNLGRARPREVIELGGNHPYSTAWQGGPTGANSSFPSGHAAIAFYLIGPWFLLRQRHPVPARAVLAGGLGYGSLVGWARILQGGHFLSDVLWAGGLVYLSGAVLALLLPVDLDGVPPSTSEPGDVPLEDAPPPHAPFPR